MLVNSLFYLGRALGFSTAVAWGVAAAFALIPQTIYFEHLYLWWHPRDGTRKSPHFQHREVLGSYETWYNRIVHGFPIALVGLYCFCRRSLRGPSGGRVR